MYAVGAEHDVVLSSANGRQRAGEAVFNRGEQPPRLGTGKLVLGVDQNRVRRRQPDRQLLQPRECAGTEADGDGLDAGAWSGSAARTSPGLRLSTLGRLEKLALTRSRPCSASTTGAVPQFFAGATF